MWREYFFWERINAERGNLKCGMGVLGFI